MVKGLYTLRNIAALPLHYGLSAGTAAAVYAISAPWAVAAAAVITTSVLVPVMLRSKNFFENHLQTHPEVHRHSPQLGNTVKKLFEISGLNPQKKVIYSFSPTEDSSEKNDDFEFGHGKTRKDKVQKIKEAMSARKNMLNASAFNFGKPIIMISEPMLKLLDDEEEKAVLAHEFAHVSANHTKILLPLKVLSMVSNVSASLTIVASMLSVGILACAGTVAGLLAATAGLGKIQKSGSSARKDQSLSIPELHEKTRLKKRTLLIMTPVALTAFGVQNPMFPAIWLAAKALNTSTKLIAGNISRSCEYQADRGATLMGANPLALMTSLRKITAVHKQALQKAWGDQPVPKPGTLSKLWKEATATHPTLERRLNRLSDIARKSGFSADEIEKARTGPLDISHADDVPLEVIRMTMSRFTDTPMQSRISPQ